MELKPTDKTMSVVKTTAISTAAIVVIAVQVIFLRAIGDVVSSLVIFGLGYLACAIRNNKK